MTLVSFIFILSVYIIKLNANSGREVLYFNGVNVVYNNTEPRILKGGKNRVIKIVTHSKSSIISPSKPTLTHLLLVFDREFDVGSTLSVKAVFYKDFLQSKYLSIDPNLESNIFIKPLSREGKTISLSIVGLVNLRYWHPKDWISEGWIKDNNIDSNIYTLGQIGSTEVWWRDETKSISNARRNSS